MNKAEKAKFDKDPEAYVDALVASHKEELNAKDEAHKAEIEELKAQHAEELEAASGELKVLKNSVPGTCKVGSATYKFKDGWKKVNLGRNKIIESEKAIKDKEIMKHLVEIGFAGIEKV